MVSFFTDFASSLVMPILPVFIVLVLDQGVDKLGAVLAITTLVSYALRFVGGALSDKYQTNKRFLILGYGLSALAKPFLGITDSWQGVAVVRSSERLGKALRAAPKDKLITQSANKEKMGSSVGLHKAIEKFGELLGLAALLTTVIYFGTSEKVIRNLFTLSAIPGLLAILVLCVFVKEQRGGKSKKKPTFSFKLESNARKPIFAYASLSLFMFGESFYLLIGNQMGLELTAVLSIYILSRALQIWVSLKAGKALDNMSVRTLLVVGYLAGLSSLLLLFVNQLGTFAIAFILLGVYDVIMLNSLRSYIGKHAIDKGATFGALYFIVAIVSAIGAYGLSLIWQHYGVNSALFTATLGMLLSGGFIAWLLHVSSPSNKSNKL